MRLKRTSRGFAVYGTVKDSRGCVVRAQQSSAIGGPRLWLFTDDPHGVYSDGKPAPHLKPAQVRKLIKVLQRFLDHAKPPTDGGTHGR